MVAVAQVGFFRRNLRRIFFSVITGILGGSAAALFLHTLSWATEARETYPAMIWGLPFAGLFIGWLFHSYGKEIAPGTNLILDEIHDPKKVVPLRMAPLILLGTIVTHFFGGSAGREGTAVQMSASLSDQLARFLWVTPDERKALLVSGAGAGFSAAIGAPFAGVIFGMEVLSAGRLKFVALVESVIASFIAFFTANFLRAPHSDFARLSAIELSWKLIGIVAIAGVLFGLTARGFVWLTHLIEKTEARWIRSSLLKPFIAGVILAVLYWWEGSYRYAGLGIPVIQSSLTETANVFDPLLKGFFTALTVGSGFKGGEFIPLVFIGTTLGSSLGLIWASAQPVLAAVGFAAVFAGASNTPLACAIMATEIFGLKIAPYALVGCFMSYLVSGHPGIYRAQRPGSGKLPLLK